MNMIESMIQNPATASATLVAHGMIDPDEQALTDQLFAILDGAASFQNMTYKTIAQFTAEIEALENDIISNHTVVYDPVSKTGNHAAVELGACSIAKNSYSYWMDVAINTLHAWHDLVVNQNFYGTIGSEGSTPMPSRRSIFGDIWRGIKRAAVDTAGFLVGGNCGGILDKDGRDVSCAWKHARRKSAGVR